MSSAIVGREYVITELVGSQIHEKVSLAPENRDHPTTSSAINSNSAQTWQRREFKYFITLSGWELEISSKEVFCLRSIF